MFIIYYLFSPCRQSYFKFLSSSSLIPSSVCSFLLLKLFSLFVIALIEFFNFRISVRLFYDWLPLVKYLILFIYCFPDFMNYLSVFHSSLLSFSKIAILNSLSSKWQDFTYLSLITWVLLRFLWWCHVWFFIYFFNSS